MLKFEFRDRILPSRLPGRPELNWAYDNRQNPPIMVINCRTYLVGDYMIQKGYWEEAPGFSNNSGYYVLTPKALTALGFDRETLKTTFSDVNLSPIKNPVQGILQAIVTRFETSRKQFPQWAQFIQKQFNIQRPFTSQLGNLNQGIDTPQIVEYNRYAGTLTSQGLVKSHLVFDEGEEQMPYHITEVTDKGLKELELLNIRAQYDV